MSLLSKRTISLFELIQLLKWYDSADKKNKKYLANKYPKFEKVIKSYDNMFDTYSAITKVISVKEFKHIVKDIKDRSKEYISIHEDYEKFASDVRNSNKVYTKH